MEQKRNVELLRQMVSQYEMEHGSLSVCITNQVAVNCQGLCQGYCISTCKGSCQSMCKTNCGMGVG